MRQKSIYTLKYDYITKMMDEVSTRPSKAREVALLIAGHYMPNFVYDEKLAVTLSTKHIMEKYGVDFHAVNNAKRLLKRIGFMELVSMSIPEGRNARPAIWAINKSFYNVRYVDFFDPTIPQLTTEVVESVDPRFKRVDYLYEYLAARHGKGNAYRLKRLISSQSGRTQLSFKYFASEIVRRGL